MADLISYNMGQIRYQNTPSLYRTDLNCYKDLVETESLGGKKYLDLAIYSNPLITFSQNESYYLRIGIPRNLSFDMTFDLKLLEGTLGQSNVFSFIDKNQYQEIKRFSIARESTNALAYSRVILYPTGGIDPEKTPIVAIAKESSDPSLRNGDVYYNSDEGEYYIKTSKGGTKIQLRNDILLNHTWKAAQGNKKAYFDCVFSSKVAGKNFNSLLVELYREPYNDDISYEKRINGVTKTYNGLYIDPDEVTVECFKLVNMINNNNLGTSGISSFDNIGVWSHPDAIMAINGEEIRIGQSGYYELNDFNITNFGIVVRDAKDRFSLDYQYKV